VRIWPELILPSVRVTAPRARIGRGQDRVVKICPPRWRGGWGSRLSDAPQLADPCGPPSVLRRAMPCHDRPQLSNCSAFRFPYGAVFEKAGEGVPEGWVAGPLMRHRCSVHHGAGALRRARPKWR